jgi:peptidoglycan/LPS O-acetylase OafA/YrhL
MELIEGSRARFLDLLVSNGRPVDELFVGLIVAAMAMMALVVCFGVVMAIYFSWRIRRKTPVIELQGGMAIALILFTSKSILDFALEVENLPLHLFGNLVIAAICFGPACVVARILLALFHRIRS